MFSRRVAAHRCVWPSWSRAKSTTAAARSHDYDLVVIGGGSGGLACAKAAASDPDPARGRDSLALPKVAVVDFVEPSPHGTTWGLGGTCVNVGCIPKKLMHIASNLGKSMGSAQSFGWSTAPVTHNWESLAEAVQGYVRRLSFAYKGELADRSIDYLVGRGAFADPHTLEIVDYRGGKRQITSKMFVIATGGRPRYPDIAGAQLGITSDDLFWLQRSPGRTLVVGGSYIALECAGFLAGLGLQPVVAPRSVLLRGFDSEMAKMVGAHMEVDCGIPFLHGHVPTALTRVDAGHTNNNNTNTNHTTNNNSGIRVEFANLAPLYFDTVLFATGRKPLTAGLNLDKAGVAVDAAGKVVTENEQTSAPHIYAIGDILQGRPELTPVAVKAGRLLAARLFWGGTAHMDYDLVPTTVFTPLEYGCVGLGEEEAIARYGASEIKVYRTALTPLEDALADDAPPTSPFCKLVCRGADEVVAGLHYAGPNAGEVVQGFATALRLGARKADLDATVGIHPTCAETLTTMDATRTVAGC